LIGRANSALKKLVFDPELSSSYLYFAELEIYPKPRNAAFFIADMPEPPAYWPAAQCVRMQLEQQPATIAVSSRSGSIHCRHEHARRHEACRGWKSSVHSATSHYKSANAPHRWIKAALAKIFRA
jgi:hypothetical protein